MANTPSEVSFKGELILRVQDQSTASGTVDIVLGEVEVPIAVSFGQKASVHRQEGFPRGTMPGGRPIEST